MHYYSQWQSLPVDAEKWQDFNGQRSHPAVKKIVELAKEAGDSILNVGCGICLDRDLYDDVNYVGLDVTHKFVDYAVCQGAAAVHASGLHLPFKDNSFATVMCKDLLVHLPPQRWKIVLTEMFRTASEQVITLEGVWKLETEYVMAESYLVNDELLAFYNNAYGALEVLHYVRPFVEKVDFAKDGNWQLTVYKVK